MTQTAIGATGRTCSRSSSNGPTRRRARRRCVDRGRGRHALPGRDERWLDGRDARARPDRHRRGGPRPGRTARLRPQRAPHESRAGTAGATSSSRSRPRGSSRVRFVTSGSDANEIAIQLARTYHVERGEPYRWQVISFAQAYHGPTMETLALTGRPGLHGAVRALPPEAPPHPAEHVAVRPDRRGGPRGARPRARTGGTRERLRVLLRADQRRGAPRVDATACASGRAWPSGANGTASSCASTRWSRASAERVMVRRRGDGVHARHHRDREGSRRRLRGDRRGALP